jgi:ATP-dependent Clp protease ATP-binding subunit ClpA
VPFRAFARADLVPIAEKMMKEEEERWALRGKKILYDPALTTLLVDTGNNPRLGARHLARNLEKLVSQPLSEAACQDDWPKIDVIRLGTSGDAVTLQLNPPA